MVQYLIPKDKKYRFILARKELIRLRLKFFISNRELSLRERSRATRFLFKAIGSAVSVYVKPRNRCLISGRAGSVYRHFKLSRIRLKSFASNGLLPGVTRSSW